MKKAFQIAVFIFLASFGGRFHSQAAGNTTAQEAGDAIYQYLTSFTSWFGYNYNHAGLFFGKRQSDGNPRTIEVQSTILAGDATTERDFNSAFKNASAAYYGAYTLNSAALSFNSRAAFLQTAISLRDSAPAYTFVNALDYKGTSFDGSIADIDNIRCDGLVEYCYEKNGATVWWHTSYPSRWEINVYPDEHNDAPDLTVNPDTELSPWSQRGAPKDGSGPSYSGSVPNNTRMTRSAVVDMPTVTVQQSPSGSGVDVWITAIDASSGIHRIGYKLPGDSDWRYSARQGPLPSRNDMTIGPFRVTQSGYVYAFGEDIGGNSPAQAPGFQVEPPTRVISLTGDLAYGNVTVGGSAQRTLTIANTGNSPLTVSSISYPNGFSGNWSGGTIAAGGSRDVTVTFSPTSATGYGGNVTVNSDNNSGTNTRAISGTGTNPITRIISLSGDLSFGTVNVGSSLPRTLNIANSGNSTLTVSSINYPNGFSGNWTGGTIAAGSSQNVTVTFSPTSATNYGGDLTVNSNATSGSGTRTLSGTGTPVQQQTGSIRVSIVPQDAATAGAQWRVVGENTWRDSGTIRSGVAYGSYQIEFKAISGWTTPGNKGVTIFGGNPDMIDSDPYIRQVTFYTLTIPPPSNGTVAKNPDQASYQAGTPVTLTATPASGYQFNGWSGDASGSANPLTVTMNANKTITSTFIVFQPNPGTGGLRREVFSNIRGLGIGDLINAPKFPDAPDESSVVTSFEAPTDIADYYGQKLSGFVVPTTTGNYTFYLCSDDQSILYLSTDDNPSNLRQIAYEPGWNGARNWTGTDRRPNRENISASISLEAGKRYYIEALMKEHNGGDNLAVAWRRPGDAVPQNGSDPIPGQYLAYPQTKVPQSGRPVILVASVPGEALYTGDDLVLGVLALGGVPMTYQWQFNGANINGATSRVLKLEKIDSNRSGSYQVVVSNSAGTSTSTAVAVQVSTLGTLAGPITNPTNGRQYYLFDASTWPAAETAAVRLGGHLVTIRNRAEQDWVYTMFGSYGGVARSLWVGLYDKDPNQNSSDPEVAKNEFGWIGGEPVTFSNWNPGEPNHLGGFEFYAHIWLPGFTVSGFWNDNYAGTRFYGVAEVIPAARPVITIQPQSQTVNMGAAAMFSVTAVGTGTLSYQWKFNGNDILGATSPTLPLNNVQPANAGNYTVVVSDAIGSTPSGAATLNVNTPPTISDIRDQSTTAGTPAAAVAFTVGDTETPGNSLTISKTSSNQTLIPDANIVIGGSGANRTVTITPVSGQFGIATITITVSDGKLSASDTFILGVTQPPVVGVAPTITTQPQSQTVNVGLNVAFNVAATGTVPLSYQWKKNGTDLAGQISATLNLFSVAASDSGNYTVVVSNAAGSRLSDVASLTVIPPSGSLSGIHSSDGYQPGGLITVSCTLSYSGTPSALAWSVEIPTGWSYQSGQNEPGIKPSAGTGGTLEWAWSAIPASPIQFTYNLNVPSGESGPKTLMATIQKRESGQSVTVSATPNPLPVNARVFYHSADTDRNWKIGLSELTRVIELYNYRVGSSRTGEYHTESGTEDGYGLGPGSHNGAQHNGDSSRDWKISLSELTRVIEVYNFRSGNSRTGEYHPQSGTEDGYGLGPGVGAQNILPQRSIALLAPNSDPKATQSADSQSYLQSGGTITITSQLEYSGQPSALGWEVQLPAGWSYISGQNEPPIKPDAGQSGSLEWAWSSVPASPVVFSFAVRVPPGESGDKIIAGKAIYREAGQRKELTPSQILLRREAAPPPPPLTITMQPQSLSADAGANVSLSVVAVGMAPLTYQWKFNDQPINGATSSTLTITNVTSTDAGNYSVLVSGPTGTATSLYATLTVIPQVKDPPKITVQPQSQAVPAGSSFTLTSDATGTEPLRFQWRFNGADLAGKISRVLVINPVSPSNDGKYSVVVSNSAGSVPSQEVSVTVLTRPSIISQPQLQNARLGETIVFTVVAGGSEPLAYQWTFNNEPITGATLATLTLNNVQGANAGLYKVSVRNSLGSVDSEQVTLSINVEEPPKITVQPQSTTATLGSKVTFVVAVSGTEPIGIQWRFNGTDIPNQTTQVLEINSVSVADSGNYSVVVSNSAGIDTSRVATLLVKDLEVRPPNDDFAKRILISGAQVSVNGSNVNATKEPGEPNHDGKPGSRTVWWSWTAPSSGKVMVSTAGSNFDTVLALYRGISLENLTNPKSNDDDPAGGETSSVTFDAIAGETYQIAVDGRFGKFGNVVLTITSDLIVPKVPVQVATSGKNLVLAWPKAIPGIVIEESDDLKTWTVVTIPPLVEGDDNFLKLPILKSSKFYRLRQQ